MNDRNLIAADCGQFISSIEGFASVRVLWRGAGNRIYRGLTRIGEVTDREPKNNSEVVHRVADRWFFENFGHKYRSGSLFCTGSQEVAKHYGKDRKIYAVAPLDGFSFCWSPKIRDLYSEVTLNFIQPEDTAGIIELLGNGDYRTIDLPAAINSGCEIMLAANGFLVFGD